MYIINGICYAGELNEGIEVTDVKSLDDMMMLITFNSGEVRLFDATILKDSAFKDLKNKDIFVNVEGNHEAIISPKVFDLVQAEMEKRKKRRSLQRREHFLK